MKIISSLLILSSLLFVAACGDAKRSTSRNAVVKTGVAPVADAEIAVIEFENSAAYGPIKIELYSNIAPKHVERFKTLAQQGFYNGVTFHRVNQNVIQGGDPKSKDNDIFNDGTGGSDLPNVPAEFSDIPFERGILGAARSQDVNSANSQFFITLQRYPSWDKNYTVFGKVIEGMNVASMIAGAPTGKDDPRTQERPLDDVKIRAVSIVAR